MAALSPGARAGIVQRSAGSRGTSAGRAVRWGIEAAVGSGHRSHRNSSAVVVSGEVAEALVFSKHARVGAVTAALVLFAALLPGTPVYAGEALTTFDFDALEVPRFAGAIEDYMTALYGSTVMVRDARTVHERDDETDVFIATSLQLLGRGDFVIEFPDAPIIGAQFEGHVIDATISEDFSFRGFHGSEEVFVFSRNVGEEIFDSGWLSFPEPVDRIVVSDTGRRDVGIDDLTVQAVPEPGTVLLFLVGLAGLSIRGRQSG